MTDDSDAGVLDGWKAWHRSVCNILGLRFVERNSTKDAISDLVLERDRLQERLTTAQRTIEELRGAEVERVKSAQYDDDGNLIELWVRDNQCFVPEAKLLAAARERDEALRSLAGAREKLDREQEENLNLRSELQEYETGGGRFISNVWAWRDHDGTAHLSFHKPDHDARRYVPASHLNGVEARLRDLTIENGLIVKDRNSFEREADQLRRERDEARALLDRWLKIGIYGGDMTLRPQTRAALRGEGE